MFFCPISFSEWQFSSSHLSVPSKHNKTGTKGWVITKSWLHTIDSFADLHKKFHCHTNTIAISFEFQMWLPPAITKCLSKCFSNYVYYWCSDRFESIRSPFYSKSNYCNKGIVRYLPVIWPIYFRVIIFRGHDSLLTIRCCVWFW